MRPCAAVPARSGKSTTAAPLREGTYDARSASPSFVVVIEWSPPGVADLSVTGTVTPASSPVGGSHVWRLQVKNSGAGTASGVVLDVQFSPNMVYGFSQVTRGTGCVPAGAGLHCVLDLLGASGDDSSTEVVIGTNVTGVGEVSLTATASYAATDPKPADNTLVLTANSPPVVAPQKPLTPPRVVQPLLGKPVGVPTKPVAGQRFTFSLPVTRSDTGALMLTGTMICNPSVAGKVIGHADSFKAGKARLSFVVPKTAKGKLLKVKVKITASDQTASRMYTYAVR